MPQLDRYLITSEIFWFLVFFLISFLVVNFLLVALFNGSRLRRVLFLENFLLVSKLKLERLIFGKLALPRLELGLVSISKLDKFLNSRQKHLQIGLDNINFFSSSELEFLVNFDFSDQILVNWIKNTVVSSYS